MMSDPNFEPRTPCCLTTSQVDESFEGLTTCSNSLGWYMTAYTVTMVSSSLVSCPLKGTDE